MTMESCKIFRCAIYTRVSTDHGLEQEFNSLDAQREASEAYIKSQRHEGWHLIRAAYDDGGYSGGTTNRPALQKLLEDIRKRKIDTVVVYKVDRLTRSLADFAKLIELFDAHGVSFVSVTQAFNTTTSMGRLTLNVLLSFAQFEREVTGERIRDKIAASKRKGMRMGGPVPLGYDVNDKKLRVNVKEAAHIRLIFQRYLDLGCLTKLAKDLRHRGIRTKRSVRPDGKIRGGIAFTKGPLAHLLKNRVYIGEIVHKADHYPGEHEPILEKSLFDKVQAALSSRRHTKANVRINSSSLLLGRMFDDRGNRMSPSSTKRRAIRYRYYVSSVLAEGRKEEAGSVCRVPAAEIETLVIGAIRSHVDGCPANASDRAVLKLYCEKVVIKRGSVELFLKHSEGAQASAISLPWAPQPLQRKREIIVPSAISDQPTRPIRAETRARLIEGIAKGRLWLNELGSGTSASTRKIATRERCSERSVRMTLSLAFLSPALVKAAVEGTLPYRVGITQFIEPPLDWNDQLARLR
jgi:site-specific DNA recombinase